MVCRMLCWKRFSLALALSLSLGCAAQSAAPSKPAATNSQSATSGDSEDAMRIKRQIRNSRHLRDDVDIILGARKPSPYGDYDELPVTLSKGEFKKQEVYYISKDGQRLAQIIPVPADPMSTISLAGRPVRGNAGSKVMVVVYDDFQCPYCRMYYQTLFGDVFKDYADRVKVVFKDYPLTAIHPWATRAAIDSECLAAQNGTAYWDFSDYVHGNQQAISGAGNLLAQQAALDKLTTEMAQKHKLDATQLQACVKKQDRAQLDASVREGDALGVEGTPAIFVNGDKREGAIDAGEMRRMLDAALRDAGQSPAPAAAAAPAPARDDLKKSK
jgi:protein-disulfide isomerase